MEKFGLSKADRVTLEKQGTAHDEEASMIPTYITAPPSVKVKITPDTGKILTCSWCDQEHRPEELYPRDLETYHCQHCNRSISDRAAGSLQRRHDEAEGVIQTCQQLPWAVWEGYRRPGDHEPRDYPTDPGEAYAAYRRARWLAGRPEAAYATEVRSHTERIRLLRQRGCLVELQGEWRGPITRRGVTTVEHGTHWIPALELFLAQLVKLEVPIDEIEGYWFDVLDATVDRETTTHTWDTVMTIIANPKKKAYYS